MKCSLACFQRFTGTLKLDGGPPMVLEQFQKDILRDHFGAAVELYVVIPKKNYKTTTLGALGIHHMQHVEDAMVPVVASTRDQAGVMFRQAEGLIRRSGEKHERRKDVYRLGDFTYEVRPGYREIRCVETRGLLKVYPAEAGAVDGIIPTLALFDELHRAVGGELYGVLSDGLDARDGRMVTISTAGSDEDGFLGQIREKFHELGGTKHVRHLRVTDEAEAYHEWALDPEDDPDNLSHVLKANPAKGQTKAKLARRKRSKGMTRGRWLRFACGIWTAGEEPEIMPQEWDPLAADVGKLKPGDQVVLAPHVGGAEAAIGIAAVRPDERVAVGAVILDRGKGSLLAQVERTCIELGETYDVFGFCNPGKNFDRSADILETAGMERIDAPWSPQRKMAVTGTFLRLVRDQMLIHDGDEDMRRHVLKTTLKSSGGDEYMDVNPHNRAAMAVGMAAHHALANAPEELKMILPRVVG